MIRGVFSAVGAVILATLLVRVVRGSMSLTDVAIRGLVIILVISVIDKVIAPMVGAGLRGLNAQSESPTTRESGPVDSGLEANG